MSDAVLSWKDVSVEFRSNSTRLSTGPISGFASAGKIHAIISDHPELSRALLQILAFDRPASGEIEYYGRARGASWAQNIGFIPNIDNLSGKLTVMETIQRSVSLRLWRSMHGRQRKERVADLVSYFGLEDFAHRKVMRFGSRNSLSLFQRKLLMLDPLAGLDDKECVAYMSQLERILQDKRIPVLLTLTKVNDYLLSQIEQISIVCGITPIYSGPTDDFLSRVETVCDCGKEGRVARLDEILFCEPKSPDQLYRRNRLLTLLDPPSSERPPVSGHPPNPPSQWPAPWYASLAILTKIRFLEEIRSKKAVSSQLVTNTVLYLLISFVFFQLPQTDSGLQDRVGLLYFLNISLLFGQTLSVLVQFDRSSRKLAHERKLYLFQSFSIIHSHFLATLPLRTVHFIIMGTALYYITGLRTDGFQHLVVFISDLILMMYSSLALGILVAVCMVRLEYGQIIVPSLVILFFIFGNLSTAPNATWILKWLQYVSPAYYSFECLIQNELQGVSNPGGVDPDQYLSDQGFNNMPIAACLPALAGFTILYLTMACVCYHYRHPRMKKRL